MGSQQNQYDIGLDKAPANYVPLTPLSVLARSAAVFPDLVSTVYEGRSFTWSETYARCRRFASYLAGRGIGEGDTVAAMLPNVPGMDELRFAVPMAGAVLDAADVSYQGGSRIGEIEYEDALSQGDLDFTPRRPADEWNAIALSYTSGTSGYPKGVVTHHRGAYLNAVSNILAGNLGQHPVYLWTLPMFHCNGWCFPWTIAASTGVNICLRKVEPAKIFELIARHGVTHMCGAPIVYNTLINAPNAPRAVNPARPVTGLIAGAAPPMAVLAGAENIGIRLTHVYGLTEVYGPASLCAEQPGWDDLAPAARAELK